MGESPKNSTPQRPELQTGVGLSAWEDPMRLRKAGREGLQAARRSGPASPGHQAGLAASSFTMGRWTGQLPSLTLRFPLLKADILGPIS